MTASPIPYLFFLKGKQKQHHKSSISEQRGSSNSSRRSAGRGGEEKFSDVGDGSENTGVGSIFQRVRNRALEGKLSNLGGSPDLLLNIEYHKEWYMYDKWVL